MKKMSKEETLKTIKDILRIMLVGEISRLFEEMKEAGFNDVDVELFSYEEMSLEELREIYEIFNLFPKRYSSIKDKE